MNSPIRILPPELKLIIRDYASDQTRPSPTAHHMKDLQFDYLPVVNSSNRRTRLPALGSLDDLGWFRRLEV